MKKTAIIALLLAIMIIPAFAKEGDIHVTRTTTAIFNMDAGATFIIPSDDEVNKMFGFFGAVTFTPAGSEKINGGIKAELSLNGFKGDAKKIGATGLLVARMYVKKSFEVYAGAGARYLIWGIESLTDYHHGWGLAVQAGARGRVSNWLGAGIQASYFKGFRDLGSGLELQMYASIEI